MAFFIWGFCLSLAGFQDFNYWTDTERVNSRYFSFALLAIIPLFYRVLLLATKAKAWYHKSAVHPKINCGRGAWNFFILQKLATTNFATLDKTYRISTQLQKTLQNLITFSILYTTIHNITQLYNTTQLHTTLHNLTQLNET